MKLGIVEWVDSCSLTGWNDVSALDMCNISKCVSAGIIREYPEHITVIQNFSNSPSVGDLISIPKVAVTRIRYLKVKNERIGLPTVT